MHVVEVRSTRHRELEQQQHRRRSRAAPGKDPLDAMLDLALDEDLDTVFTAQLLNSDEEAVARLLNHPHSLISLSDAGAHLTFFNDAGFGLHLLGHWVRDRGVDEPARRGAPADAAERARSSACTGAALLREGYAADLLLFDPATWGAGRSAACSTCPAARAPDHRRAGRARRVGQRRAGGRCERAARCGAPGR